MSDENQFDSLDDLSEDEEADLEENPDLTRLEDLSEFLHEEDPETDQFFESEEAKRKAVESGPPAVPPPVDLDDLDDDNSSDFGSDDSSDFESDDEEQSFDTDDSDDSEDSDDTTDFGGATDPAMSFDSKEFNGDNSDDQEEDQEDANDFSTDDSQDWGSESDEEENEEEENDFYSTDNEEDDNDEDTSFDSAGFDQDEDSDNDDPDAGLAPLPEEDEEEDSEEDTSWGDTSFDEEDQEVGQVDEPEETVQEFETSYSETIGDDIAEGIGSFQESEEEQPQSSPTPSAPAQPRENFQEVRDFGNSISYGTVSAGGNPPFGLVVRGIRYEEDAEDILILLREHGLASDENEATMKQAMENGSLLISQISEYSAIYLAHKMRRFDVNIEVGLSEEIHPSKSYENDSRGLVSKYNLRQNIAENMVLENHEVEVDSIVMSTTPTLDGYHIHHYLEVVTSHTMVEEEELRALHAANEMDGEENYDEEIKDVLGADEADEVLKDQKYLGQYSLGLGEIYNELVVDLRNQAYKVEANGVVGINFQITPLIGDSEGVSVGMYKITCTGNAVWIVSNDK